jgi:hypothetical protein
MNTTTIATEKPIQREEAMDVLWGAWVKQVRFHRQTYSVDVLGIYEVIEKEKKADFPFLVDLKAVFAFSVANEVELGQSYTLSFDLTDKYAVYHPFTMNQQISVPKGDLPMRWYQPFTFSNVLIKEPVVHYLYVSIERQFKFSMPLWILAPKLMVIDDERDITTEMWPEDWEEWKREQGEQ